MRRTAPLIVGGGPAGCAAAIALAAEGARALVLERRREIDDALCGGFLSWRTLRTLAMLGIEADALHRQRVGRVRILGMARVAEAALPAPGLAVSRRRLDTAMLARAEAAGAAVERGVTVRAIAADPDMATGGHRVEADGETLVTEALFLASGKHEVRGLARPAAARGRDPTLGLRLRMPAHPALARMIGDAVELHPFRGGYAGLVIQEDGTANLCMAVKRSRLREAGSVPALFRLLAAEAPRLGERIGHADGLDGADAVANVPYGWRATAGIAGLFRLGDQAGVIPSLAGEGMGIAVATGRAAAAAWAAGGGADRGGMAAAGWQRDMAAALRRPLAVAGAARWWAEHGGGATLPWLPPAAIRLGAGLTRFDP